MELQALYIGTKQRLKDAGIDMPALDARLLICHALKITPEKFLLSNDLILSEDQQQNIDGLIAQREAGKPVAKIIGRKEFYGREFNTTTDTLDPRPDSETLIEAVLQQNENDKPLILDLGTGTGCLVLTLLAEIPHARAIAVDQSKETLNIAKDNAWLIGVEDRIVFAQSDWFKDVVGKFDIIISNPPYIPEEDIAGLSREVRLFDPMAALTGGADGLDPYRIIIPQMVNFLKPGGHVAFEVGQGQAPDVAEMLVSCGFDRVTIHNDLAGIGRVVCGFYLQNPPEKLS